MQTLSISPQNLLTILIGQQTILPHAPSGQFLLATHKHAQLNLPSEMAGCIVYIDDQSQATLVALVHPFHVAQHDSIFDTNDRLIHREPYNWFGPQALVIEKKLNDFSKTYDGPLTEDGAIPRNYIPDNIAQPALLSDEYWNSYLPFVNDPTGSFAQQVQPLFKHNQNS